MALSPHEFVLALRAGIVEWRRSTGVSIGGLYIGPPYIPIVAGVPVRVRATS